MIHKLVFFIPLLPLFGALLNGVLGRRVFKENKNIIHTIACGTVFLAFVLSVLCAFSLADLPPEARMDAEQVQTTLGTFIPGGELPVANGAMADFEIAWSFRFDPLSAFMVLFITGVGFLIHVYSIGYMAHEEGYSRFFAYLNLFMAMMLTLVLAANAPTMFIGWEGVGLCSYLLIGFLIKEKWTSDAANKAFITNRVGDFFMLLAMGLAFTAFGTLDFAKLNEAAVQGHEHMFTLWGTPWGLSTVCTVLGLLIFLAATAKSAQFPLHVWLPDAMAGPTPVSALIHAATMVTSGVYILTRLNGVFQAGDALALVAVVGAVTAVFAATIAMVQNDIKKVLAYSTVSQLGYMFLAIGVGAFSTAMFHMLTHAFFKALLFLCAGSVIHAMSGEQDMRKMGGLKDKIPVTRMTMLVGCLAISGIPIFSGFFSKDEILWNTLMGGHSSKVLWAMGLGTAILTSFYMFRLYFMTFFGKPRMDEETAMHVHESPRTMTVPLVVLAALATVGGFLGLPALFGEHRHIIRHWLEPVIFQVGPGGGEHGQHSISMELLFMAISVAAGLLGLFWARAWYRDGAFTAPESLRQRFTMIHKTLSNKYYIDEAYYFVFVDGVKWVSHQVWWVDKHFINGFVVNGLGGTVIKVFAYLSHFLDHVLVDGLVNLQAWWSQRAGAALRHFQTGGIQSYALYFVFGMILLVGLWLGVLR